MKSLRRRSVWVGGVSADGLLGKNGLWTEQKTFSTLISLGIALIILKLVFAVLTRTAQATLPRDLQPRLDTLNAGHANRLPSDFLLGAFGKKLGSQ